MTEKKLVSAEKLREVALNNGYEVFDKADVAAYIKDTMMKSQAGEISQADREEFTVEMAGLQKAICANEDGSQCTLYYRKPLVDWKIDGNGVVMKGIAGTYTDTFENRKLNRVGRTYVPSPDVIKSIYGGKDDIEENTVDAEVAEQASSIRKSCVVVAADAERRLALGEIDEELCKSVKTEVGMYLTSWGDTLDECCDVVKSEDLADVREDLADASAAFADIVKAAHGRYADNAQNRRLHRVGQEYGKAAQEGDKDGKKQGMADGESGEKQSRNGDSVKRDISILEENKDRIVEKYGQEAYDKKIEALKKEGEDFEQKETVKQLKERADKQDAEEEERKKAEKRAKRQERRRARHAAKREAAKKAKEEAEAKAKAEAEEKQKQEPEKKKQKSSEEDTNKGGIERMKDTELKEKKEQLGQESEKKEKFTEFDEQMKSLLGVERGEPMSTDEADQKNANPHYGELVDGNDQSYTCNCQTCVVAYELRKRGYDVEAQGVGSKIGEYDNPIQERIANDPTLMFTSHVKQNRLSELIMFSNNKFSDYVRNLRNAVAEEGRYFITLKSSIGNSGHITTIENNGGKIFLVDPQKGYKVNLMDDQAVREFYYRWDIKDPQMNRVFKVDDLEFNPDLVKILKKK